MCSIACTLRMFVWSQVPRGTVFAFQYVYVEFVLYGMCSIECTFEHACLLAKRCTRSITLVANANAWFAGERFRRDLIAAARQCQKRPIK